MHQHFSGQGKATQVWQTWDFVGFHSRSCDLLLAYHLPLTLKLLFQQKLLSIRPFSVMDDLFYRCLLYRCRIFAFVQSSLLEACSTSKTELFALAIIQNEKNPTCLSTFPILFPSQISWHRIIMWILSSATERIHSNGLIRHCECCLTHRSRQITIAPPCWSSTRSETINSLSR